MVLNQNQLNSIFFKIGDMNEPFKYDSQSRYFHRLWNIVDENVLTAL
jgi:hypothetical protein